MTTYLEQITALGEADGLAHKGWNYPDTYRQTEVAAYVKGYDIGYWFREYRLGYKAGVDNADITLKEPWIQSKAFMLSYKEGTNARQRT
jgi:hypothetical protein